MTSETTSKPIGIFDSGIGGLTVAQALVKKLPHENIVYFGDTAHLPYGDKSTAAIQSYAIKITQFLLQQQCKLILIACHTASSAAYELVKEYSGNKAQVVNVIDPVVTKLQKSYANKKIGLIGTKATIHSNIYKKRIDALNKNITLKSQATPLLASAIEEGFYNHPVIDAILEAYLSNHALDNIDALILGCTHYPIIKKNIARFYQNTVEIIDPSDIIADAVKSQLETAQLIHHSKTLGEKHFYISDYTQSFEDNTRLFFDESISLEHYPIWD